MHRAQPTLHPYVAKPPLRLSEGVARSLVGLPIRDLRQLSLEGIQPDSSPHDQLRYDGVCAHVCTSAATWLNLVACAADDCANQLQEDGSNSVEELRSMLRAKTCRMPTRLDPTVRLMNVSLSLPPLAHSTVPPVKNVCCSSFLRIGLTVCIRMLL